MPRFDDWLDVQRRRATPKSLFGQAVDYSRNQWASLVRYFDDARFALGNGAAERAIRPLAIGRANWLHVGGDGGLKTAAVLLSVCASATRHRLSQWSYLRDVLDQLAVQPAGDDEDDLLPDTWASRYVQTSYWRLPFPRWNLPQRVGVACESLLGSADLTDRSCQIAINRRSGSCQCRDSS